MVGRLEIRGLRCAPFLVDLSVRADLAPAALSDDLSLAVDLAALAATVREVVGGPARALLETVVVNLAHTLLERFAALEEVRVRIRVPEPAGLDAAEEAIEVTLART